MQLRTVLFFSTKYWPDSTELQRTADSLAELLAGEVYTVVDGDISSVPAGEADIWQIVAASGAVQPHILNFCREKKYVLLFPAYASAVVDSALSDALLQRNAAPAVMDVYAVLKRDARRTVYLCTEPEEIQRRIRVLTARNLLTEKPLLLVGAPEPWVISVPGETNRYEANLGVRFLPVPQELLLRMYEETPESDPDVLAIRAYFAEAQKIMEPTFDDLTRCSRMGAAMLRLLRERDAAGMAIACFDLIRRCGVNPCLGVSYINGETEYVASCEGDTDSAVTMRMIRALGLDSPFMANPCLRPDGTVNFAHCTAPVRIREEKQRFWLYNHHETGVGASVRVFYEAGQRWTMLRYSGVENVLTVQGCTVVEGRYEPNCRTQLCVLPDDRKRYLDTLLGCHQVLVYGDRSEEIRSLAELVKIGVR